jgi:hypothetical protein
MFEKLTINLRSSNNSLVKYNIPKVRTLCHQNSYLYEYRVCGTVYQMSYGNQNYHSRALNHVL